MKRILILAISATLLAAGCQKTRVINQVNPVGEPEMTFSPGMSKLTKAADADGMANLESQYFSVWAYADYEDPLNDKTDLDQIYDGMEGAPISYNGAGGWIPNKDYYWPGQDKKLNFFAVSPASVSSQVQILLTGRSSASEAQNPYFDLNDFVVTDGSVDLMVADFVNQAQNQGETSTKQVKLKFRHTLSKIQFLFRTEGSSAAEEGEEKNDDVHVQSIQIENVVTQGDLSVSKNTGADATTKPCVATWTPDGETQTFFEDYAGKDDTADLSTIQDVQWINMRDESQDLTAMKLTTEAKPFATWLCIPQSIENLKVKVLYLMGKRQMQSTFVLHTNDLKRWGENQYIKYTITLTPNKITFTPEVGDWEPKEGDNINMGN
jgi:hypothetical protein